MLNGQSGEEALGNPYVKATVNKAEAIAVSRLNLVRKFISRRRAECVKGAGGGLLCHWA